MVAEEAAEAEATVAEVAGAVEAEAAAVVVAATDDDADRLFHRSRDKFVILPALKTKKAPRRISSAIVAPAALGLEMPRRCAPRNHGRRSPVRICHPKPLWR